MVGGTVGGQCLLRVIVAGPLPILISSNKEVMAGNRRGRGEVVVTEEVGVTPAHRCVGFLCVLFLVGAYAILLVVSIMRVSFFSSRGAVRCVTILRSCYLHLSFHSSFLS